MGSPPNRSQRKPLELPCEVCGTVVLRHPCRLERFNRVFCSRACYRVSLVGHKQTDETRAKRSAALSGDKAPKWNGGISRQYKRGYKTAQFKRWRTAVFQRDDFTCQHCGQRGGYLTAHHIKGFAAYPDLRYEVSNGLTLCEECHKKTDNYGGRARRVRNGG